MAPSTRCTHLSNVDLVNALRHHKAYLNVIFHIYMFRHHFLLIFFFKWLPAGKNGTIFIEILNSELFFGIIFFLFGSNSWWGMGMNLCYPLNFTWLDNNINYMEVKTINWKHVWNSLKKTNQLTNSLTNLDLNIK